VIGLGRFLRQERVEEFCLPAMTLGVGYVRMVSQAGGGCSESDSDSESELVVNATPFLNRSAISLTLSNSVWVEYNAWIAGTSFRDAV
jgi:hypothetical protein